jgi:hypothetical protein
MPKLTFIEWVAWWGEPRLEEIIAQSRNCSFRMWEERHDSNLLWSFPAWELCLGPYWQEPLTEWHARWQRCGGILSEGRMIAPKWDVIWERLSGTFDDGLGQPFPPYARSSCAHWTDVGQDEAIVVGAISESAFRDYMGQFPREPLRDKDGNPISKEFLEAVASELADHIYRNGGPRPGASRAERVAHERKRREESFARAQAEYEELNRKREQERAEQNAVFRLLEQVEAFLQDSPPAHDSRWEWLCSSVQTLTATAHFERYPNWRARAWVASAELHRLLSDSESELACLQHALSINSKLPIKRRIKKLASPSTKEA